MLHLYHSNRLECLAGELGCTLAGPAAGPLVPETVVVQSPGMARWLYQRLAAGQGIAANIEFPLPASFVWRLFRGQLPTLPEHSPCGREVLRWRVMGLLPRLIKQSEFGSLRDFLGSTPTQQRRFQLAGLIADSYDRYLIHRPELISSWDAGKDGHWQARLWRALRESESSLHRTGAFLEFKARWQAGTVDVAALPARLSVFGLAGLPPMYLEVLALLAERIEVHAYVLNPSQVYWGDITDPKRIGRLQSQWRQAGKADAQAYFSTGNPLLASMGGPARDLLEQLHEYPCEEQVLDEQPAGTHCLAQIQRGIYQLEDPTTIADVSGLAKGDRSLQIHRCHGPMREIQVLHDQLLALFAEEPDFGPQDIVVMTPDIAAYAPCIEAVFEAVPRARHIPWELADVPAATATRISDCLLRLLGLGEGRMSAPELLELLENPLVARRYQLDAEALERLRSACRDSGIRWGLDEDARAELGMPVAATHTWQHGLRRLLLGYAIPTDSRPFHGVTPCAAISGREAESLGILAGFIEDIVRWRQRLRRKHSLEAWARLLRELVTDFLATEGDEEAAALQMVLASMGEIVERASTAEFSETMECRVITDALELQLKGALAQQRFPGGRVTFCGLVPMRCVPFRVVCLIGMNEGAFPRHHPRPSFDLMARQRRRGDRVERDLDRYLFLEALLSARDVFYISYVGASPRDDSPIMPAAPVSELQDYVQRAWGEDAASVVTRHPLQPFSSDYFRAQDSTRFSYANEWMPPAPAQVGDLAPMLITALASAERPDNRVALDELVGFFSNPVRVFLKNRLGIGYWEDDLGLAEAETFSLDPLERYGLRNALLDQALTGESPAALCQWAHGSGLLPSGTVAAPWLESLLTEVSVMAEQIRPRMEPALPQREVELLINDALLHGDIHGLSAAGCTRYRGAKLKGRDRIALWLPHLALHAVGSPMSSLHIALDKQLALGPEVADVRTQLATLIELYHRGQSEPLPFFPDSAWAYAEAMAKDGDEGAAMKKALKIWRDQEGKRPEYRSVFRRSEPLGAEFRSLAEIIYEPLIASITRVSR